MHDELLLEVPDGELMAVRTHLPKLMSQVAELAVPLVLEVGVGANWEAAHQVSRLATSLCPPNFTL